MPTVIATLISIGLLISSLGVLAQGGFKAVDLLTAAWVESEERTNTIANTRIEVLSATHSAPQVDISLKNTGDQAVRSFEEWDVLVQYYESGGAYHTEWLSYTSAATPGNNEWTVRGIYIDAGSLTTEVFEPNVFNPDEELIVRFTLSPAARTASKNQVALSTPNGVTATTMF